MSDYLDSKQVDYLLKRPSPSRVIKRSENGKTLSYLEGHDVKAQLIRCFGFGRFSSEVIAQDLVCEEPCKIGKDKDKDGWKVAYRSIVRLTVCAPNGTVLATYAEGHVGQSIHPDKAEAHANALTNSETYALKRCAIFLGDGFGLGLYNNGNAEEYVKFCFRPDKANAAPTGDEELPETKPESEYSEPREDVHQQSAAPIPEQPGALDEAEKRALRVADLVAQLDLATSKTDVALIAAQGGKERLNNTQCADGRTFGAHVDAALRRTAKGSAA